MNDMTKALPGTELSREGDGGKVGVMGPIGSRAIYATAFRLEWRSERARRTDLLVTRKLRKNSLVEPRVRHFHPRAFDSPPWIRTLVFGFEGAEV